MPRTFLRPLAALLIAALGAAACADSPTDAPRPGGGAPAELGVSLDLAGTSVAELSVRVTATDIAQPLVFNLPVSNGTASGVIRVPAGPARTITISAFASTGQLTHQGSRTVEVLEAGNPAVSITLQPVAGDVPINVNFGSLVLSVRRLHDGWSFPELGWHPGRTEPYVAFVTEADGTPVEGARVRWASLNPAVASVDSTGMVTARAPGTTQIVVTYAGYAASTTFQVLGDGTNGTVDHTPPTLVTFTLSRDTVDVSSFNETLTATITAWDVGAGLDTMMLFLAPPSGANGGTLDCVANRTTPRGSRDPVTLSCTMPLSGWMQNGDWRVDGIMVVDSLGNRGGYFFETIYNSGFERTLTIVNGIEDYDPPSLDNITFLQDTVHAPGELTVVIEANDGQSGIGRLLLTIGQEGEDPAFTSTCYREFETSEGRFVCRFSLDPEFTPEGELVVREVTITDLGEEKLELDHAALQALGIDPRAVVVY